MPKRNAFYFFMRKRREDMILERRRLPLAEIPELVSEEWKNMDPLEKEVYTKMANEYNEKSKKEQKEREELEAEAVIAKRQAKEFLDYKDILLDETEKLSKKHEQQRRQDSTILVASLLEQNLPQKMPVLILAFSFYNNEPLEAMLVAEVGLSVFNIESGVLQNFAALVDPGPGIHNGLISTVEASTTRLALPYPNYDKRAQNFGDIVDRIFEIGQMYSDCYNGMVTFHCLEKDTLMTEMALQWLMYLAGIYHRKHQSMFQFQLLPLEFMVSALSSKNDKGHMDVPAMNQLLEKAVQNLALNDSKNHAQRCSPQSITKQEAALVAMKEVTDKYIAYPKGMSILQVFGLFLNPSQVVAFLSVDNYGYFEELACQYHVERRDGVYHCPLNVANRYAFLVVQHLAINYKVIPLPWAHYPIFGTEIPPWQGRDRRKHLSQRWSIFDTRPLGALEASKDPELIDHSTSRLEMEEDASSGHRALNSGRKVQKDTPTLFGDEWDDASSGHRALNSGRKEQKDTPTLFGDEWDD